MDNEEFQKAIAFVDKVIAKGDPWTDSQFKPHRNSIYNDLDSAYNRGKFIGKDIRWVRASELRPKCQVFKDGISVSDIKQGSLGNCYFMSALTAIAEYPQ